MIVDLVILYLIIGWWVAVFNYALDMLTQKDELAKQYAKNGKVEAVSPTGWKLVCFWMLTGLLWPFWWVWQIFDFIIDIRDQIRKMRLMKW